MILKIYNNGRIAEIIINSTTEPVKSITADELVFIMLKHGVTAAKIINSNEKPGNRRPGK